MKRPAEKTKESPSELKKTCGPGTTPPVCSSKKVEISKEEKEENKKTMEMWLSVFKSCGMNDDQATKYAWLLTREHYSLKQARDCNIPKVAGMSSEDARLYWDACTKSPPTSSSWERLFEQETLLEKHVRAIEKLTKSKVPVPETVNDVVKKIRDAVGRMKPSDKKGLIEALTSGTQPLKATVQNSIDEFKKTPNSGVPENQGLTMHYLIICGIPKENAVAYAEKFHKDGWTFPIDLPSDVPSFLKMNKTDAESYRPPTISRKSWKALFCTAGIPLDRAAKYAKELDGKFALPEDVPTTVKRVCGSVELTEGMSLTLEYLLSKKRYPTPPHLFRLIGQGHGVA